MCGIVGYIGNENVKDNLLEGLKKLEYRGYDSAGICLADEFSTKVYKSIGKVNNLKEKLIDVDSYALLGIAHTRWATHGAVSERNSHPHSCKDVTLVHNGIIENYKSLGENFSLKSETDSEVIAAVISEENGTNLERIQKAMQKLEGSFALAIIFSNDKENIYVAKRSSPLVILKGESGNYIASDIGAYSNKTNSYLFLEDNEIGIVSKKDVTIYDSNLNKIDKSFSTLDIEFKTEDISPFSCYMEKEIYEQPSVIIKTINKLNGMKKLNLKKYSNITVVACGSAMHAGNCFKYLAEEYLSIPVNVEIASEFRYKKFLLPQNSLVILVSQSGETADTLAALNLAKEHNAHTLAIVNVPFSSIAREADDVIYTVAGPEISVATTKAYIAQIATFMHIILNEMENPDILMNEFKKIPDKLEYILNDLENVHEIAKILSSKEDVFFIGRNIDSAFCMEGSLKLKEISYIHSESYAAGELKHGTISLISENTPVIAIATKKEILNKTLSNLEECKSRGAFTILITNKNTDANVDLKLLLPDVNEFFYPIICQVYLQLIAFYTAKEKKLDIDKPRNLAKSVTVE